MNEARPASLPRLPTGWLWVQLGEIADVRLGKMLSPKAYEAGLRQMPYLRNENVRWFFIDTSDVKAMGFTESELQKFQLRSGDLLVCEGGEPGRCAVVTEATTHYMYQKALHRVRPSGASLNPLLLQYCFRHFISQGSVFERRSETTIQHLPREKMVRLYVPLPPKGEQDRIVAEIEKQFSRLDAGVAALKRVGANLRRYKASVLKGAALGELLDSPQERSAFAKSEWQPVGQVVDSLEQGWSPKCEREASEEKTTWAVIKTTAVQPMRYMEHENKRLPPELSPRPNLELTPGDLLITRAGPRSRCGICCLVRSTRPKLMVCDKVYRMRCDRSQVNPEYLELILNAHPLTDALDALKTGISDSGVNLTQSRFCRLLVPLPSLSIQEALIGEVARFASLTEETEIAVRRANARAQRLRQSILKHAFEGKLVEQDPQDEPASVLLHRIRAERTRTTGAARIAAQHGRAQPRRGRKHREHLET